MATTTTAAPQTRTEQQTERGTSEGTPQTGTRSRTVAPAVDVFETDRNYVVLADMAGVKTEGLEVIAERDVLVIEGRIDAPQTAATYREFELANYRRTFVMTEDLDTDGITAVLHDGVLRVEIPKSSRLQPKKIPVRTA
jgi:HSP20 family protein